MKKLSLINVQLSAGSLLSSEEKKQVVGGWDGKGCPFELGYIIECGQCVDPKVLNICPSWD